MPLFGSVLPHVAVVELWGVIGGGVRSSEYARIFNALGQNAMVRAVVVDIDSPGGTATASDYLYGALERLGRRKPVVAFVRGTAASGAYLVSCAATRIVAIPSAIVGSIGVISVRPVLRELLARVGVQVFVRKTGPFKDMWAFYREPTDEEQQKIQGLLEEFHEHFVTTVAQTRRLEPARAREYATGEVFTARRGLELGLVDELGDLDVALERATELAKVPRRVVYVRPRRPLLERLAYRGSRALVRAVAVEIERRLFPEFYYRSYR
ncbi:MAG: signal peptide peptidase SppA [Dehalococcoidia bacterium]